MPDLFEVKGAAKVRCFGKEAVLDGLKQPSGTLIGRITPDEVIFVGEVGTAAALVEDLQGQLAGEGNAALVVDHTDGWSLFSLVGEGIEDTGSEIFKVGDGRNPIRQPRGGFAKFGRVVPRLIENIQAESDNKQSGSGLLDDKARERARAAEDVVRPAEPRGGKADGFQMCEERCAHA